MPVPNAPRNCAPDKPASVVPWTINLFENATFALPSTLLPAKFLAVVHFPALVAVAAFPPIDRLDAVPVRPVPAPLNDVTDSTPVVGTNDSFVDDVVAALLPVEFNDRTG